MGTTRGERTNQPKPRQPQPPPGGRPGPWHTHTSQRSSGRTFHQVLSQGAKSIQPSGASTGSCYGSTGPRLSSTWWVSQITSEVWSLSSFGRMGAVRFLNSCFILKLTVTSPSSFCGVTLMKTPTLLAFLKAIMLQGRTHRNTGSAKFSKALFQVEQCSQRNFNHTEDRQEESEI